MVTNPLVLFAGMRKQGFMGLIEIINHYLNLGRRGADVKNGRYQSRPVLLNPHLML
jgi:hypothetical protein